VSIEPDEYKSGVGEARFISVLSTLVLAALKHRKILWRKLKYEWLRPRDYETVEEGITWSDKPWQRLERV
jgi:hypothetical protein